MWITSTGLHNQKKAELGLSKPFFFNAPIDNWDTSVIDYFKRDSNFRFAAEPGEWKAVDHTGIIETDGAVFYFHSHPLFKDFDTGKIDFCYITRNGNRRLHSVCLILSFKDEEECKVAYDSVLERLKDLKEDTDLGNNEYLVWLKDDFSHFKYLYLSYTPEAPDFRGRRFYWLRLQGKDGSF